jgi:hypothetical protein
LLASPNAEVQLYAAWALINASIAEANKARIAVAGGISLLTMLLTARAPKMQVWGTD